MNPHVFDILFSDHETQPDQERCTGWVRCVRLRLGPSCHLPVRLRSVQRQNLHCIPGKVNILSSAEVFGGWCRGHNAKIGGISFPVIRTSLQLGNTLQLAILFLVHEPNKAFCVELDVVSFSVTSLPRA